MRSNSTSVLRCMTGVQSLMHMTRRFFTFTDMYYLYVIMFQQKLNMTL